MLARLTIASAMPARLMGLRSSIRSLCRGSSASGGVFSVSMLDLGRFRLLDRVAVRVCDFGGSASRLDQSFCIEAVLLLIVMQRHLTVPPGPVHGINIRIEEHLIEMPDDDGEGSQNCFI